MSEPSLVPTAADSTGTPAAAPAVFGAIDIGASSGRVVAGVWDGSRLALEVVHRFANGAAVHDGLLRWDLTGLYAEVLTGLTVLAQRHPQVTSIGIDTWAVDYGLLDDDGRLLAEPVSYRDQRTAAVIDDVHRLVGPSALYAVNGLQHLPFTTLYQLAAEQRGPLWPRARQALLLPDLIGYWLTGVRRTEITNASTTGLLDARTGDWSADLFERLGLPAALFPPLIAPGEVLGPLRAEVRAATGLSGHVGVVAVGSHDTASAVVGVPAVDRDIAYVSSGTWSLVGVELDAPVLGDASRAADFTNEGGVDGRVRYLRNVGGLWLLQESLRTWRDAGLELDQDTLLAEAAASAAGGPVVDVDAAEFIAPGDMPSRIAAACRRSGRPAPESPRAVVRCILDSLATAYARVIAQAEQLSGRAVRTVHIVGGGCQNELLCRLTADLTGLPVIAGPVEATALGNLAVQARTAGLLPHDLDALRRELREGLALRTYAPQQSVDGPAADPASPRTGAERMLTP